MAPSSTAAPAAAAAAGAVAPFLTKLFDMVDDPSTDKTVSWTPAGNSFVIWDQHLLCTELLPRYFRHNNFASFVRQLNTYGFHKVDPDKYEFANDGFLRGRKHLLKSIVRRKGINSASQVQAASQAKNNSVKANACIEVGKFGLEEDIAMLKRDKNVLMQELVKLRQHQQSSSLQVGDLTQRLRGMEANQQQMLSFLAMAVQSPGFLAQVAQQNGNGRWTSEANKKRRFPALEQGVVEGSESRADGQIIKYQPFLTEMPRPDFMPAADAGSSNVQSMTANGEDLCTDVGAMSLGEEEYIPSESDFSMSDFSDIDWELLLASPLHENTRELEPAISDFIKDLGFSEQDNMMDTSDNGSCK